jgi:hypothetical protein
MATKKTRSSSNDPNSLFIDPATHPNFAKPSSPGGRRTGQASVVLDESSSISESSESSSSDSGEYERTLEQENDELRKLVKQQSQTIQRLRGDVAELRKVAAIGKKIEAAFVPEFRVPIRAMNSCCVACGTKIGSLHAIGLGRDIAIHRIHNIVVHRKEHKLCSTCLALPIQDLKIEAMDETLRRRATYAILLDSYSRTSCLNFFDLSEADMRTLTGLTWDNLIDLRNETEADLEQLFQFFLLCRQGWSQRAVGIIVGKTQPTISKQFHTILETLKNDFMPKHLRYSMREIEKSHIPKFVATLFPKVRGVIDGGYYFINKSVNFNAQKQSYSPHKFRNLVKVMGIMLPDGRWWDILGMLSYDFYSFYSFSRTLLRRLRPQ